MKLVLARELSLKFELNFLRDRMFRKCKAYIAFLFENVQGNRLSSDPRYKFENRGADCSETHFFNEENYDFDLVILKIKIIMMLLGYCLSS